MRVLVLSEWTNLSDLLIKNGKQKFQFAADSICIFFFVLHNMIKLGRKKITVKKISGQSCVVSLYVREHYSFISFHGWQTYLQSDMLSQGSKIDNPILWLKFSWHLKSTSIVYDRFRS